MEWTPNEIIANICGVFASFFVNQSMPAYPLAASLSAGVAEGAIKGIFNSALLPYILLRIPIVSFAFHQFFSFGQDFRKVAIKVIIHAVCK